MVKSPIKVIESGNVPTTENLGKGQVAFGQVGGSVKFYGSDGTTVSELQAGTQINNLAPLVVDTAPTTYDGDTSSIAAGYGATSGTGDLSKFPETWRQQIEGLISSVDGKLSDVSIGGAASTTGLGNVAVGAGANAGIVEYDESEPEASMYKLVDNTAIGSGAVATGGLSVAIGGGGITSDNGAKSTGLYSVAVGVLASATGMSSVAIGVGSSATEDGEFSVGGGDPIITRRITHVTDPTGDQDAATKKYVDNAVAGKADTSALDNYATKTELTAKADQTAVDTLTVTVNSKANQSDLTSLQETVTSQAETISQLQATITQLQSTIDNLVLKTEEIL